MGTRAILARFAQSGSRGQILPLVGLSLIVFFGMATMAIDVGYLRFQQRLQQSATDSGAIAGANELAYSATSTRVTSAADGDVTLNGYTDDGGTTVTVTVNHPPSSGLYSGVATAVEVIVLKKYPVFFWGIFGVQNQSVSTRAVAVLNPNLIGCVYALNGNITLHGGGGGGISAHDCGIMTNGNLDVTGNANFDARFIGYAGSGPGGGSYPEGQPIKTVPAEDPCPTVTACAYLAALAVNTLPCVNTVAQNAAALPPGRYCSGSGYHTVSGDVTFAPTATNKLYVFDQDVPTGAMNGTAGVTIYNNSTHGITWNGNTSVTVVAPTSGPTSGMVYYQPPSNTNSISKNGKAGTIDFEGGFYAPGASVTMDGNLPSVSLFVVGSVDMNGSGMTVVSSPGLTVRGHAVLGE